MRRLLIAIGLVLAVLGVALAIAAALVDPQEVIEPQLAKLSERLGREVEVGAFDFSLLPAPAVRLQAVRVGGPTPAEPSLLEVDDVRVRVALLPLLIGRVVLSTLEVHAPRVHLELDDTGRPLLPDLEGAKQPPASQGVAGAEEASADASDGRFPLAVRAIEISDGRLEAGPWQVVDLNLRGRLRLDGSAQLRFDADLPGLATLREARLELEGLFGDNPSGSASVELGQADLAAVGRLLEFEPELAGQLDGPLRVSFSEGKLWPEQARLSGRALRVELEGVSLEGDVTLVAERGGSLALDLTRSRVRIGQLFDKPRGVALTLDGTLGTATDLSALGALRVALGPNRVPLELDLAGAPPAVVVQATTLDLAPLAELVQIEWMAGLSGQLQLDRWQVELEPLAFSGKAQLRDVRLPLERGTLALSGPLSASGSTLELGRLDVAIGDQVAGLSGTYDLRSGRLSLEGNLEGADVEALGGALVGSQDLAGTLDTRFEVNGPPDLRGLLGRGSFAIREGRIRGFSLIEQLLGDLAALPVLVAQLKGKDLSRYHEEEFQLLSADWRLRDAKLLSENLTLQYRHSTAYLHGSIGLLDGALNLAGRVEISEELDATLAEQAQGQARVIPIAGISGTLSRPRVRIDASTLASLAATYAGHGRVRTKLEEKLGKEGAEAVDDLLNRILRGR